MQGGRLLLPESLVACRTAPQRLREALRPKEVGVRQAAGDGREHSPEDRRAGRAHLILSMEGGKPAGIAEELQSDGNDQPTHPPTGADPTALLPIRKGGSGGGQAPRGPRRGWFAGSCRRAPASGGTP